MNKKISRRKLLKATAGLAALTAAGCVSPAKNTSEEILNSLSNAGADAAKLGNRELAAVHGWQGDNVYEFIVVGSGAGGGPLASRLAQAGFSVLLVEAGSNKIPVNASIPILHPKATDDPAINWSFFVKRYSDPELAAKNSKYVPGKGIYYPRGSALGGSTMMNAMISLYPDHRDWENIRTITGDSSWNHKVMYEHFERLQLILPDHLKPAFDYLRSQAQRGWLDLSQNSVTLLLQDPVLLDIAFSALRAKGLSTELLGKIYSENFNIKLNPNTQAAVLKRLDGLYNIPVSVQKGVRRGVRDFILDTQSRYPENLKLQMNSLVKSLLFPDNDPTRCVGVEYAEGASLYSADPKSSPFASYSLKKAFATKEVILCGGAFNTPQLLQLSGVGDENLLRQNGITPRAHLPGVGLNLQDRYEISVVSKFPKNFDLVNDCGFGSVDDACMKDYLANPDSHLYSTNGATISWIKRSSEKQPTPDLCIFGVPGFFRGYYPSWGSQVYQKDHFTWLVLKGHTKNKSGSVSIRTNDFRDRPEINFRAFEDGTDFQGEDMQAILSGIDTIRDINRHLTKGSGASEVYPGKDIQSRADLRKYTQNESWGHHASCTSAMGRATDEKAVVDSEFRVHKMKNLRIVDASVFPDIPGLFIMVPILTISEKAAQILIKTYGARR